jgi:hypothetical protein
MYGILLLYGKTEIAKFKGREILSDRYSFGRSPFFFSCLQFRGSLWQQM